MTAENCRDGRLGTQTLFACGLVICVMAGCRKQEAGLKSQAEQVTALAQQKAQNPPTGLKQEVRLPPVVAAEILGRWKIFRYDFCGIIAMGPEEANWYIGKTVLIEPGRMVFNDYPKDNVSKEIACHFTSMNVNVADTEDYLVDGTRCSPGDEEFVQVKEKKIKVFWYEGEENCGGTPFGGFFKPNFNTIVMRWNLVYLFMKRETNEIGGAGNSAAQTARMPQ